MKTRWSVEFLNELVEQEYRLLVKSGVLSLEDNRLLKQWVHQVEVKGPENLRQYSFWNDHALEGKWFGYRSSSFSYSGRLIYKIEQQKLMIFVVRVTPDHNYRR